jgi:hypothetical protein
MERTGIPEKERQKGEEGGFHSKLKARVRNHINIFLTTDLAKKPNPQIVFRWQLICC